MTYQWGNNHGSIMEANGKWYVFYHRQTGINEFSRQAMLEPVDVALGKDGALYIGDIRYLNGEPVSSRPVEMTSQGAHINGLDARQWISAGYACHIYGSGMRAYIEPRYEQRDDVSTPVVGITSDTTVGFRYLQFGSNPPRTVTLITDRHQPMAVNVRLDSCRGRIIARLDFSGDALEQTAGLLAGVVGKHAVYFEFLSDQPGEIASFNHFTFS